MVTGYLLPLAVPLLLFSADLQRVARSHPTLTLLRGDRADSDHSFTCPALLSAALSTILCLLPITRLKPASAPPLRLASAQVRDTGRLLGAFAIGATGTVLGTFVGLALFPMTHLGDDAWKARLR